MRRWPTLRPHKRNRAVDGRGFQGARSWSGDQPGWPNGFSEGDHGSARASSLAGDSASSASALATRHRREGECGIRSLFRRVRAAVGRRASSCCTAGRWYGPGRTGIFPTPTLSSWQPGSRFCHSTLSGSLRRETRFPAFVLSRVGGFLSEQALGLDRRVD
jgi:hypothetical protein